jgi:G6PDH family F420-dependent oxidoreductase
MTGTTTAGRVRPKYGFTLYCEGFGPCDLVKQAIAAEKAGFDFLVISDRFQDWSPRQQHATFAWSVIGAIAQATSTIELVTVVGCAMGRSQPEVIAQAAATTGVLSEGRFTVGFGMNAQHGEYMLEQESSFAAVRRERMYEAAAIIRKLWAGERVSFEGKYFQLNNAKIFDLPKEELTFYMAAGCPESAVLAAEIADGVCSTDPDPEILDAYVRNGGDTQGLWAQVVSAYIPKDARDLDGAHAAFRFATGGGGWKAQPELLAGAVNLTAATKQASAGSLGRLFTVGPDPQAHADSMQEFIQLGVTRLAIAYPGRDLDAYLRFWQEELRPLLP